MEKVDYTSILADIDAKIAALESARRSIQIAVESGALGLQGDIPGISVSGSDHASGTPYELPVGFLRGKSVPVAIKLYLDATKKKQTVKHIAEGIRAKGMETTARNFESIVTTALHRMKGPDGVIRFADGWDLVKHHSAHIRNAMSKNQKQTLEKIMGKQPAKGKTTTKAKPRPAKPKGESRGLEERIEQVLNSDKSKSFSAKEVAELVGNKKVGPVAMMLGRMAKKGKAEKGGVGAYRAAQGNATKKLSAV